MNREILREKIEEQLSELEENYDIIEYTDQLDTIMSLIDEYVKPKTKKKSLEERSEDFAKSVWKFESDYKPELIFAFTDYWTEHNEGGQKMRFEMSKNFNIKDELIIFSKSKKDV